VSGISRGRWYATGLLCVALGMTGRDAGAQARCQVQRPVPALVVPLGAAPSRLDTDPKSPPWAGAATAQISRDCSRQISYQDLQTEVRAFWTQHDLYLLFTNPYRTLNLFLPAQGAGDRDRLWDRDVVEMFLGADWGNIRQYREFEIAPTGDHVDLAIDLARQHYDQAWSSGWETAARIDQAARVWFAAARIPLTAVSASPVTDGTRWRINLYRIDGEGPDSLRRFLCWQPTCVVNQDPNHVPEAFGTLVFSKGATPGGKR